MQDFKELKVWGKAHALTLNVYSSSQKFPKDELYGLTNQIRRSCASIPTNIAEGCGRNSRPEFSHFLQISMGSASELEYQLLLARDLAYLSTDDYDNLNTKVNEIKRMLSGLIHTLNSAN
jgi:four helix bundle protein